MLESQKYSKQQQLWLIWLSQYRIKTFKQFLEFSLRKCIEKMRKCNNATLLSCRTYFLFLFVPRQSSSVISVHSVPIYSVSHWRRGWLLVLAAVQKYLYTSTQLCSMQYTVYGQCSQYSVIVSLMQSYQSYYHTTIYHTLLRTKV